MQKQRRTRAQLLGISGRSRGEQVLGQYANVNMRTHTLLYSFGAKAGVGVEMEGLPAAIPPLTAFAEYLRIVSKPATSKMLASAVVSTKETMLARKPSRTLRGRCDLARPPLPPCYTHNTCRQNSRFINVRMFSRLNSI